MARKSNMIDKNSTGDAAEKYKPAEERKGGPFDSFEISSAKDTLIKAMRIKKNPALLRAIKRAAETEHAALTKATAR